jgi:hypothetical protein
VTDRIHFGDLLPGPRFRAAQGTVDSVGVDLPL